MNIPPMNKVSEILTLEKTYQQNPYIGYTEGIKRILQNKLYTSMNIINFEKFSSSSYYIAFPGFNEYPGRPWYALEYLLQEQKFKEEFDDFIYNRSYGHKTI